MAPRISLGARSFAAAALALLLGAYGCGLTQRHAPVTERTPSSGKPAAAPVAAPAAAPAAKPSVGELDTRPEYYTVKPSDTLYTIALDHGLDYKELAEWNGLENPNMIRAGQQLRLTPPVSTVVATPLRTAPAVEGRPVTGSTLPPAAGAAGDAVKSQPKAVKVPYSDQALAQLSAPQAKPAAPVVAPIEPRPVDKTAATEDDDGKVDWGWPTNGKLLSTFNETTNLKGIGIGGKAGQAVIASASGRVLYSGEGIRGFGKLVIIKHNKVFLSVYAHNSQLLVKEGQNVAKGQKIAEMGNTDSDQIKLHFEIRRFGKPVDPIKLLPPTGPL
jgi:lipoprotein NlpD